MPLCKFHRQKALDHEDLLTYATEVGLDVPRFDRDRADDEVMARIARDITSGEASGVVRGTPTLFIDGVLHEGGYDTATLLEALQRCSDARTPPRRLAAHQGHAAPLLSDRREGPPRDHTAPEPLVERPLYVDVRGLTTRRRYPPLTQSTTRRPYSSAACSHAK
jgi:hypothetical protein